jgi:beta-galactosidase/beta-glucuronidase
MFTCIDFYNYAGIDRSVTLYTTSSLAWLKDLSLATAALSYDNDNDDLGAPSVAKIAYTTWVEKNSSATLPIVRISINDANGAQVAYADGDAGSLVVNNPILWQPCADLTCHNSIHLFSAISFDL